ncbi:MAG: XdhC family protein [Planctomycetota bacterium]
MSDPLYELLRRADAGERLAVCALAKTTGSTPQKAGALMLVLSSGQIIGTIGGGCVEAEVRSQALCRLSKPPGTSEQRDALLRFPLDRDYGWDDGLVCGGVMFVAIQLIESASQAEPWRDAFRAIADGNTGRVQLSLKDEQSQPVEVTFEQEPKPKLVIAGAGHIGEALAQIAHPMGFEVTVVDDRAQAASPVRFPDANRVVGAMGYELSKLEIDQRSYVVIVTRGHQHDGEALAAVVESNAKYLGLIGSRRKVLSIYTSLLEQGTSAERLRRVRSPIGLKLGAREPAEIAVSIAAELIACRRGVELGSNTVMQLSDKLFDGIVRGNSPNA